MDLWIGYHRSRLIIVIFGQHLSATALVSDGLKFFCCPSTSNCRTSDEEIDKGLLKQTTLMNLLSPANLWT